MAADRSIADAILTEHFRYTPLSVIDDIINSINTIIYKALTALESGLLAHPPKNLGFVEPKKSKSNSALVPPSQPVVAPSLSAAETARAEIENGTHKLETLLEAAVDKNFDIFELFALQHIFNIDPDLQASVRLQHYQDIIWPLALDDSDDDGDDNAENKIEANGKDIRGKGGNSRQNKNKKDNNEKDNNKKKGVTPREIRRKRERLTSARSLGLQLEQENLTLSSILSQLQALTASNGNDHGSLAFLTEGRTIPSSTTGTTSTPLTTTSQFSTSQLPGLKILLSTLRSKIDDLPTSAAELSVAARRQERPGSTSDEERRRYVEHVARRAVRGALGYEARGSEDGELGPKRSVEEVEGLEGIIAGFDDGGEQDEENEDEDGADAGSD